MKFAYLIMSIMLTQHCFAQTQQKASVSVGDWTVPIPSSWIAQPSTDSPATPIAIKVTNRSAPPKRLAEILGTVLEGSVEKESTGMKSSADQQPEAIRLLEAASFKTEKGISGAKVALLVNASDKNYGPPFVFYSMYLPQRDGSSVTIKLKCDAASFRALKGEFEQIVRACRN